MTVSSSTNKVSYSGNGTLTTFAYTFKVFDQSDLTVILRAANGTETTQTITTHYTVTGVGEASGGNVVFGTAPASGVTVVIIREQPLTQGLDLVPNDPFPAESLEEALDKLTFMSQKHEEELSRAIKASRTNTLTGSEFTISATDRANKVFAFDSSGNLSITQELGTFKGDWATSTAYVERDLVKDTTTNNVFIVNAAHTSSGSLPLTTNANSAKYEKIIDVTNPPGNFNVGGDLTVTGSVTGASFVIGSADINENDLEAIDSVTAGTVAASKAVVVDVNKDISSFRNLTASGTVTYGSLSDGSITVTAFVDEDNMASDSATLIPTQQSVKAYVDSQVGASDTLTEILGNGNTTSGANIQLTTTDELQFRDTALKISSSADGQLDIDADTELEITAPTVDINASTEVNISGDLTVDTDTLHVDSSNNRVGIKTTSPDNELTVIGTGFFGASTAGVAVSNSGANLALISGQTPSGTYKPLKISSTDPSSNYLYFDTTSGIGINNDSPSSFNSKLVIGGTSGSNTMTIASGTTGVGNIHFADGTSGDALDEGYIRYHHQFDRLVLGTASATVEPLRITSSGSVGIKVAGDPSTELEVNGTVTATGFVSSGNMTFGDSNKAIFGAGSDLQIYHDGSNSYIKEAGTGSLVINATDFYLANSGSTNNFIRAIDGAQVDLYYGGSIKLTTTSTGIDVTGTVTADGLTVDGTNDVALITTNQSNYTEGLTLRNTANWGYGTSLSFEAITSSGGSNAEVGRIQSHWNTTGRHGLDFYTLNNNTLLRHMRLDGYGDFSLYEDTGTTAKLFWDASTESLGLGTTSPDSSARLDIYGGRLYIDASDDYALRLEKSSVIGGYIGAPALSNLAFYSSGGAERMRIDSSGRLLLNTTVEGYTDYADDFTISNTSGRSGMTIRSGNTSQGSIFFSDVNSNSDAGGYAGYVTYHHNDNRLAFGTSGAERMRISSTGDVGIGTASPSAYQSYRYLDVAGGSSAQGGVIQIMTSGQEARGQWAVDSSGVRLLAVTNHNLSFHTNATQRMTIASYGSVGIGTSTPTNYSTYRYLDIMGSATTTGGVIQLKTSDSSVNLTMYSYSAGGIIGTTTNHNLAFLTNNSVRMLIDTSGNLLVGTTTTNPSGNNDASGVELSSTGQVNASRSGANALDINRGTSDGEIARFRKDGTTVGSIATEQGDLVIGTGDTGVKFNDNLNSIYPYHTDISNGSQDNLIDLGVASVRFDDIYATNGTIQTSDRNEKQDIAELTDAEQRVAVAAKGLLRKFRWKTAVAEKGDEARTHFGIIAQDLQAAFAAEGLDASDYAMFISTTWTDEETGEERTRMGVRYSELLAFIIAAI